MSLLALYALFDFLIISVWTLDVRICRLKSVTALKGLNQYWFNPLSPHDALMHHIKSLKTYLILLRPRVLGRKFP